MSILNLYVSPTEALICVDTLLYTREGSPRSLASKVLTIPHLGAAMVVRCAPSIAYDLLQMVQPEIVGDFDDLLKAVPPLLSRATAAHIERFGSPAIGHYSTSELGVFGYSSARKRIAGVLFKCDDECEVSAEPLRDDACFAPEPTEFGWTLNDPRFAPIVREHGRDLQKWRGPATMIALARIQAVLCAELWGIPVGGDLVLTRVTKQEIAIKHIYRFPNRDVHLAEMRAHAAAQPGERGEKAA